MKIHKFKKFSNGAVYSIKLKDGRLIETTDTFLPYYTKDAIGQNQNKLHSTDIGSRAERWMIGVSVMSGCPVGCKFCATGQMKGWRNLSVDEIVDQVRLMVELNYGTNPVDSKEFKINYTRMGEPFLNIKNVRLAIDKIDKLYPNVHHYVSTIGIKNAGYSWIKDNITLQLSIHSFEDEKRNWLIPFKYKDTIEDLGKIRTQSNLKTTLNCTLVDESDFDIKKLNKWFDKDSFFVKLSPINTNTISDSNGLGKGAIESVNLV